ncbi:MAG: hypothetical protein Tsb002_23570 [Wenzhouxiangellaceae bacterium]
MNLATRLFLSFTLLIAIAVGVATGLTYWLGSRAVEQQAGQAFNTSQAVQRYFIARDLRELELISELIASDRAFVAYIAQSLSAVSGDQVDTSSIADLLSERSAEYNFDFAMVLSTQGAGLVEIGGVLNQGSDLSQQPSIAAAVSSGGSSNGLWLFDDKVYKIAVAPLVSGFSIEAFLLTGQAISGEFMNSISRVSGIELAYVAVDESGARISGSTLPIAAADTLAGVISRSPELRARAAQGETIDPVAIELGGAEWLANISPLEGNASRGLLVSLVPADELFQTFSDITNVLILSGLAAVLLALIISLTAARQIIKPIEQLSEMSEAATRGEYRGRLQSLASGSGELRRLHDSFNRLISDLRERQAAENYFEELWQHESGHRGLRHTKMVMSKAVEPQYKLEPGDTIGQRYEILELAGKGGMGVVYKAIDQELNEVVALKMLRPEQVSDEQQVSRLKSEIRLARRITHPNIVRTYDFSTIDGIPLISMEYVRGISLESAIRQFGKMNFFACLRLAIQICDAVDSAHQVGVLHRDLKPANVMITHMAKVMDFGIAFPLIDLSDTQTEANLEGTPEYLAPEQILGQTADARADIYSLGILLTEMFTGKLPHEHTETQAVLQAHINQQLISPSALWPEIPAELESILVQCLQFEPEDRWQSASDLREALQSFRLSL